MLKPGIMLGYVLMLALFATSTAGAQEARGEQFRKGREIWSKKRCAACHMIGSIHSGPDLAGVTQRRSREWLYRWLNESEKMIKEGDSTAVALLARYNRVVMENQKLSKKDVDNLLVFFQLEEERILRRQGPARTPGEPVSSAP